MMAKLLEARMMDQAAYIDCYPIQTVDLMKSISQHAQDRKKFELHVLVLAKKQLDSGIFHPSQRCTEFYKFLDLSWGKWQQQIAMLQRQFAFWCIKSCRFLSIVLMRTRLWRSCSTQEHTCNNCCKLVWGLSMNAIFSVQLQRLWKCFCSPRNKSPNIAFSFSCKTRVIWMWKKLYQIFLTRGCNWITSTTAYRRSNKLTFESSRNMRAVRAAALVVGTFSKHGNTHFTPMWQVRNPRKEKMFTKKLN